MIHISLEPEQYRLLMACVEYCLGFGKTHPLRQDFEGIQHALAGQVCEELRQEDNQS